MKKKDGMIYVFEGYGKGKTSAALGVAVRMLLLKKNVVWISWFKERRWKITEMRLARKFKDNLKMHWMGRGFYGGPDDHDTPDRHINAAEEALSLARDVLATKEGKRSVDLLVLDEVIRAVNDRVLKIDDLLEVINNRGATHLVLTGHDCPVKLREVADLVTEMKKIKHPFDKDVLAVRGLDF